MWPCCRISDIVNSTRLIDLFYDVYCISQTSAKDGMKFEEKLSKVKPSYNEELLAVMSTCAYELCISRLVTRVFFFSLYHSVKCININTIYCFIEIIWIMRESVPNDIRGTLCIGRNLEKFSNGRGIKKNPLPTFAFNLFIHSDTTTQRTVTRSIRDFFHIWNVIEDALYIHIFFHSWKTE